MLSKTFNLLFYLKKRTSYTGGKLPIYMRVTVDRDRFELATNRDCDPDKWNAKSGRLNGNREETKLLNSYLESLRAKVYDAQQSLLVANKPVTALGIKNILTGVTERPKMFCEVFKSHNSEMFALIGKGFSRGTYNRYEAALRNVKLFLQYKHKIDDVSVDSLNYAFISDYAFYLRTARHISHNVAMRYLKYIKKIVLLCVKHNWLARDPFFAFKISFDEIDRNPLAQEELSRIREKRFENYRLRKVRDIFLFCCYTGLAYIDVKNLKRSDIINGHDGRPWIVIKRQKTGTPSRVPLLPVPRLIIDAYQDDPACVNEGRLLPVLTNQKMNSYLKEIADVCGINRPITFHLARHTFATTVTLSNDVPIETVSKMLGHKDLKTTQHYARIVDRKISKDMELLTEKLS